MPRKKEIEIVLDTETTGLDYTRERIIEFAAVRLENGKIKDVLDLLHGERSIHEVYLGLTNDNVKIIKDSEVWFLHF